MASVVPGYNHDVFVNYATVVDRPAKCGWMSAFVNARSESLAAAIGLCDPRRVWWDRSHIDEEASLTEQIRSKVQKSACMVVILSRGYSKSQWCRQEREAFLAAMAGQPDAERRHPSDRQRLGFPTPDPENKDHMEDQLARDICERITKLPGTQAQTPPPKTSPDVTPFVAEAADDVAEEREEVVRFLTDHSIFLGIHRTS